LANVRSQTIANRLAAAEVEAEDLSTRIEHAHQMLAGPVEMPDDDWIAAQLKDLASLIRQDERRAAILLRKIFGKVYAFQTLPPGKERGYAYLRLRINGWELLRVILDGKIPDAFPSTLARFGVCQTKAGRKVSGKLNVRDVLSDYCQHKKQLLVERLDRYDTEEQAWAEILVDDKHVGPADTAIVRIDFSTWLQILPRRLRTIAAFLATGETTTAASKRFRLSQGRISQIRRQLLDAWQKFQGDMPVTAMA
jgi:hypothetical protein